MDFPRIDPGTEENPRTAADDDAENVRPYWVHIRPSQLFFADADIVNGKEVLREIRIMETVQQRIGFAEVSIAQIRRIFMVDILGEDEEITGVVKGAVELYQIKEKSKDGKDEWEVVDSYTFDLDEIPLVTFYADRDDFMLATPPLQDLVDLNIAHWQSTSDQRAILTTARFPILALSGGVDDNKELIVGPNIWLYSPDPKSKFYYVEHTGAAIEAGRKDLEGLETQMDGYGAEFLKKRPGNLTATARALDSAEATSPLQDMTLRFKHSVDRALALTAKWFRIENGGKALIATDFGPEEINQADLDTLRETRKMKDISRPAYLKELIRRGLLDDDFDIEKDALLLEQAMLDFAETIVPFDEDDDDDDDNEADEE